jgi:hypothetical protein
VRADRFCSRSQLSDGSKQRQQWQRWRQHSRTQGTKGWLRVR